MGRHIEAIAEDRKSENLDPLSLIISTDVAMDGLAPAGMYDEALRQCRMTLELDPNVAVALACLARNYEYKGMNEEAIAEMQKAVELSGDSAIWVSFLGYLYARANRRDEATKILNELKSRSKREFVPPAGFIWLYASLGDKDQAFAWLEKAYEERSDVITVLNEERALDPLRSDPRFLDLVRRVGLPSLSSRVPKYAVILADQEEANVEAQDQELKSFAIRSLSLLSATCRLQGEPQAA